MVLSSAEKAIFISRRSVAKMYNIFIWCMRINVIFLRLPVLNFFSLPRSFPFSQPFCCCYLLRFLFFSGCRKKIAKPGNRTLINYRCNGPFYRHFFFVFQFATSECRQNPKPPVVWISLSLLYHLIIKKIW